MVNDKKALSNNVKTKLKTDNMILLIRLFILTILNIATFFLVTWIIRMIPISLLSSYYYLLAVLLILIGGVNIIISFMVVETSFVSSLSFFLLLFIPVIFIISILARALIIFSDILFPEKVRELLPIITAYRMLLLSIADIFISPERSAAMEVIQELDDLTSQQDQVAKGYAARKAIGQTIDYGLSFAILVLLGLGPYLLSFDFFAENPWIIVLVLSSFTVVISLLATLFGPVFTYFSGCKNYCLKHGAYRGASIFWNFEQLFSIPFLATKSGFMLLDMPPIDAETYQEFSSNIKNEFNDIQASINTLLAKDKSQIPSQMRNKIQNLMNQSGSKIFDLNFETIKEEVARDLALNLYRLEFPLIFWRRKKAVNKFAEYLNINRKDAEDILRLIGLKIDYRQAPVDMVNAILVAGAMKGIVQKEQEYHELLTDADFAEISTGLAFGVRQFIEDQYELQNKSKRFLSQLKNFFISVTAPIVVLFWGLETYLKIIYSELREEIRSSSKDTFREYNKMRWQEIFFALQNTSTVFVSKLKFFKNKLQGKDTIIVTRETLGIDPIIEKVELVEKIPSETTQLIPSLPDIPEAPETVKNRWKSFFVFIIKIIFILPVAIITFVKQILGFTFKLVTKSKTEEKTYDQFQADITHAALSSCYIELYSKLVDASSMFHRQFSGSEPVME